MHLCYLATILLDRGNPTESITRRRDDMWHYSNRNTPNGVMLSRDGWRLEAGRPHYYYSVAKRYPTQFCKRGDK